MRRTAVVGGALLVAGLVFGTRGCAFETSAGQASGAAGGAAARPGEVSLAFARQVLRAFVTTDGVARAAGAESLELSLVNQAQQPLTVAAYEQADFTGTPAPRYRYGAATLYVPPMTSFPLWFAAVAPRAPARGGPTRTAIMVFSRPTATDSWQLSLSTLLAPGATLPRPAIDATGHAVALATFDHRLLVSPNSVGAAQAALADDGPGAAAATVVAAGPYTTGVHDQIVTAKRSVTQQGLHYDSILQGSSFPLYALATSDGGALVLYSLVRSTVILRTAGRQPQIQIPPAFAPLLYATGRVAIKSELDTGETYQYAAYVPADQPAGKAAGKAAGQLRVIAADGGPTSAGGT
jgi:hypothetical protein